jgi:hypothetical protein
MKNVIPSLVLSFICAACAMGTDDGPPGSEPSGTNSGALAVPQAGRAPSRPGKVPTLPPEVEERRQAALASWKSTAQALMSSCVARPGANRQPVRLEVAFAPLPGNQGGGMQVLMPGLVHVSPHEFQKLGQDMAPERFHECLSRVRALPLTMPIPGASRAPVFHPFSESMLIHL